MTQQRKTAEQSKAEGVYLLLQVRLVAAQNLLRSVRQDHAEQCRLIALGAGGNIDGFERRMCEAEAEILKLRRVLVYAEQRVRAAALHDDRPETPIMSRLIPKHAIQLTENSGYAILEAARDIWHADQAEIREVARGVS